ncbi:GldM family protein [Flavobacterium tegetincola]|uniref:GldM family protein n=1 Tax=Flavobacterium tegetincola TaxID=150172 RepID=UPI000418DC36|nr:GldM family protein [Flavobacterium tegetincola]
MRNFHFLLLFLFSFSVNAQSDTIISAKRSVIALDKVKTIYRGFANPISIAVSDCKSFKVEGIGLQEKSNGKYVLIPGAGTESKIVVTITNFDDSISVEEHTFIIRNFTNAVTKINGSYCDNCILLFKKEDLKDAYIDVSFRDLNLDYKTEVTEFTIKISKKERIVIKGNRISDEVYKLLKSNQKIVISDIKTKFESLGNIMICRIPLILLKVE